ncbi:MAG: hypothetical protein M0R73_07300 [Dehalococcoidia bacterium]|nr:hypothetical protein [Dehalococcoidia bacterium]
MAEVDPRRPDAVTHAATYAATHAATHGSAQEGPGRFAFALGTFHATALVVAAVLLAHARGGLDALDGLNTMVGLALFALLWAASVAGTHWALRDVHVHALDVALRRGVVGGGISGLIVLGVGLAVFAVLVPFGLVQTEGGLAGLGNVVVTVLFIVGVYGVIGAVVAAVVGGALGFVFALVDWAILGAAGLGNGFDPRDEVARGG